MTDFPDSNECRRSEDFAALQTAVYGRLRSRPDRERTLYEVPETDLSFLDSFEPGHVLPFLGTSREKERAGIVGVYLEGYRKIDDHGKKTYALRGIEENFVVVPVPTSVSQSVYRSLERELQTTWMRYAYALRYEGLGERYAQILATGKGNALKMQQRIYDLEDAYRRTMKGLLSTKTD